MKKHVAVSVGLLVAVALSILAAAEVASAALPGRDLESDRAAHSRVAALSDVGGPIGVDTVWTRAGSPYVVTSDVTVQDGVTLTVEAGVEVRFDSLRSLIVQGTLVARGTATSPITFTSNLATPAPGDWGYIYFTGSSVDAAFDGAGNYLAGSILQYAVIEYAGGDSVAENGALRLEAAAPYVDHAAIHDNRADGIHAWSSPGLRVTHSVIAHNGIVGVANANGIYVAGSGHSQIAGNAVTDNAALVHPDQVVGGIAVSGGSVSITGSTIDNNGTGMTLANAESDVSGNHVRNNIGDGGIRIIGGNVTITDNVISYNESHPGCSGDGRGGGIDICGGTCYFLGGGTVTITHNTITNNRTLTCGNRGGGIRNAGGSATIDGNEISGNTAEGRGGAICGGGVFGGSTVVSNNVIAGNSAMGEGGGVYGGGMTIRGNMISGNRSSAHGGGLFVTGGVALEANTIADNTAAGDGGGLYLAGGIPGVISNTITGNAAGPASGRGGGIFLCDGCRPPINRNDLYGNSGKLGKDLYNGNVPASPDVDAEDNYWGVAGPNAIETLIWHHSDDAGLGVVDYAPYAALSVLRQAEPLVLGQAVSDTVRLSGYQDYSLAATAGQSLLVEVLPLDGSNTLYVYGRLGDLPLWTRYDLRTQERTPRGAYELMVWPAQEGTYYFGIYGRDVSGAGGSYRIVVNAVERYLSDVSPRSAGNAGQVTLSLSGLPFTRTMEVAVRASGLPARTAYTVTLASPTSLWARFDLSGAVPGVYDLVAIWPDSAEASLAGVFAITLGAGPHLEARLIAPQVVRSGNRYVAWLEYANTGDADMLAPVFHLTNSAGANMRIGTDGEPSSSGLAVLGVSEEGAPMTLAAGSRQRIPISFVAPGEGSIRFDLTANLGDDTPVDWDGLEPVFRPDAVDDETWPAVWAEATTRAGSTWGEVLSTLAAVYNRPNVDRGKLADLINVLTLGFGFVAALPGDPVAAPSCETIGDVHLVPDRFDPQADCTYVVTHGWNASAVDPTIAGLAQGVAGHCPSCNIVRVDWGWAAGTLLDPWLAACRTQKVADEAYEQLEQWLPAGYDWNTITYIGHSFGNVVNLKVAEHRQNAAGVVPGRAVVLDPANHLGGAEPNFGGRYQQGSVSVSTWSWFDAKPGCEQYARLADRQLWLETGTANPFTAHGEALHCMKEQMPAGNNTCSNPWLTGWAQAIPQSPPGWFDGEIFCDGTMAIWPQDNCRAHDIEIPGVPFASAIIQAVRPCDPNEKAGPAGFGPEQVVRVGDELYYTVYFENVVTATAPAQQVFVTDYLDPDLDWSTFRLGEITFGGQMVAPPESTDQLYSGVTLPDYRDGVTRTWWVEIRGELNPQTGKVLWAFRTLDPETGDLPEDPLAGFLPPNDDTGRGEGHVSFSIKSKADRPLGTRLTNRATIVFDANEAIETNEVWNVVGELFQHKVYLPVVVRDW